ncbi:hypothetical protein JTE90_024316 [Oedothorax gibbosus]|uniref:Caspase Dronc n=1 Tax=Oedothorax gibbosus TaxID=931172 RepID=A0AAV6W1B6_9ARAC|nr:hypothetical protein JTE90_024316 [Oedothorax gibbosus]
MDHRSRNIILRNKANLELKIDLEQLKPHLVKHKIFSRAMLKDIFETRECDLYTELLTRGPDALGKFLRALNDAEYHEEAKILSPSETLRLQTRMCYKMISKPLGYCKIINNVKFDFNIMEERFGSDMDASELSRVFYEIGYEVFTEHNLTDYQMRESLEKFAANDWTKVDSCIIIILSHGDTSDNQDMIYGVNNIGISKMDIYEMFDNRHCKQLQDKPKIFIFQACRGVREDNGVKESTDATVVRPVKRPFMSDMLVVHSALPNHVSYRDFEKGTWFCQDLVQVLSSDYLNDPLETMLQRVDRKMGIRLSARNMKQVTHIDKYGLKADIYFCLNNLTELPEFYIPFNSS